MSQEIGRTFFVETDLSHRTPSDQALGVPQPAAVKSIGGPGEQAALPPPDSLRLAPVDFPALVHERASLREYAAKAFSQEELSFLLWCTQGVKRLDRQVTSRTVPSAGSRHAFETLLLVQRVEGLAAGLYAFDAIEHRLRHIDPDPGITERLSAACLGQPLIRASAVTFFWIAVPQRMTWRYGERGYRYLLLDAGHVCQNLYLAAETIGAGACAVAAFDDDALNSALGLTGGDDFVIYAASCGKRPAR